MRKVKHLKIIRSTVYIIVYCKRRSGIHSELQIFKTYLITTSGFKILQIRIHSGSKVFPLSFIYMMVDDIYVLYA